MVEETMLRMIAYSKGNLHDIHHFIKVHAYAKLIGECENIDPQTLKILELAAIVHDIACPLCREKYGNTNGKNQEKEGIKLTKEFFQDEPLTTIELERIVYLVGHHHTLQNIEDIDYQILIEADYLVNAAESHYTPTAIHQFTQTFFKTKTGLFLAKNLFQ